MCDDRDECNISSKQSKNRQKILVAIEINLTTPMPSNANTACPNDNAKFEKVLNCGSFAGFVASGNTSASTPANPNRARKLATIEMYEMNFR